MCPDEALDAPNQPSREMTVAEYIDAEIDKHQQYAMRWQDIKNHLAPVFPAERCVAHGYFPESITR